jgi:hypothetical protein
MKHIIGVLLYRRGKPQINRKCMVSIVTETRNTHKTSCTTIAGVRIG